MIKTILDTTVPLWSLLLSGIIAVVLYFGIKIIMAIKRTLELIDEDK
jgi:hypothetical protein